jgi:hypothetical protein
MTGGPIVPLVEKIVFYELDGGFWPTPREVYDLKRIYETVDREEIDFLLGVFEEETRKVVSQVRLNDSVYALRIFFSTAESLFIPFELYENMAMLRMVSYGGPVFHYDSPKLHWFMRRKEILDVQPAARLADDTETGESDAGNQALHQPMQFYLDDADLSGLDMKSFPHFEETAEKLRGRGGEIHFRDRMTFDTKQDFIGSIDLEVNGTISASETDWIFQGMVQAANCDFYNFEPRDPPRPFPQEQAVAIYRTFGKLFNSGNYYIYVTRQVPKNELGSWESRLVEEEN